MPTISPKLSGGRTTVIPIDSPVVEDRETALQDVLTDLMHLAVAHGWDWDDLQDRARRQFEV